MRIERPSSMGEEAADVRLGRDSVHMAAPWTLLRESQKS